MSNSERNINSGSAAAALGFAIAVDDIQNVGNDTNSHNSADTSYDNDVSNSHNQDNDTSYDNDTAYDNDSLDVNISDNDVSNSHNQDNDNTYDNDTFTKVINDNDTFTKTVNLSDDDIKNSYNQDNDQDNDTTYDNDVSNSYNQDNDTAYDNDVSNSHNTTTTDVDTTVSVAISDSFKEITDSYNQDNDWLELEDLGFDVLTAVGQGALSGGGNDSMFNISQVSELHDSDTLCNPTVSNDGSFDLDQYGKGGSARGGDDFGDRGTATASADGVAQMEAFTQNIVMGANIQYNNVDMSVVGGNSTSTDGGDIS